MSSIQITNENCDNVYFKNDNEKNFMLNFSIDHILKKAGNNTFSSSVSTIYPYQYQWLQCSRYCPPKLQRITKKEVVPQKRRLGNHPRIPFTKMQLIALEEKFKQDPYLSGTDVKNLSNHLEINERRVKIWFQNRRAKQRREVIESKQTEQIIEDKSVQYTVHHNEFFKNFSLNKTQFLWNQHFIDTCQNNY